MGIQVAFSYQSWLARYPEFGAPAQPVQQASFTGAIDTTGTLTVTGFVGGSSPLAVGMIVSGIAGVAPGTNITAFVSGTGGNGTYTVSTPQVIPATAMTAVMPSVAAVQANGYFAEAQVLHANDGCGPVDDPTIQAALLNMVVAHIAARYATVNGHAPTNLVGRVDSAGIGPVNASVEGFGVTGTEAWWLTTKYGSDYWRATAPYRQMHYVVHPRNRPFPFRGIRI